VKARYLTCDVFTDRRFGGNQLAVFPDAREIPAELMQPIAREFNFSETTFVLPPEDPGHAARVRIFTPNGEIQFGGHPTIGTAFILATLGVVPLSGPETRIVLGEIVGPIPVRILAKGGRPDFVQLSVAQLPQFGPPPPSASVLAAMLSLKPDDLAGGRMGPEAVSCGAPFLFVPVRDRSAVAPARLDLARWHPALDSYVARMVYVFARDAEHPGHDLRARMFAPNIGVAEDPATGAGAAALGGYLGTREPARDGTFRWVIEQGFEMGRPSLLEMEVDKAGGAIVGVRVGGRSVLVSEGTMEV